MLFNSVGQEKENRTLEVLLVSIQPRELLAGKTIAAGWLALVRQSRGWLRYYVIFNMGGIDPQTSSWIWISNFHPDLGFSLLPGRLWAIC